jgi:two-component system heavy metal sensor histidine kinase CusS
MVSLVLIAGVGIYLYASLDRRLDEEHATFLADDVELLRRTLAESADQTSLAGNPRARQWLTPIGSRLRVAVYDAERKPILDTQPLVPLEATGEPAPAGQPAAYAHHWKSADGRSYRVVAAWGALGKARTPVLIVLSLDISIERRLLRGFRETLWLTILIGVFCASGLGYILTRQGLRPLNRIARAAGEITSSKLARRLDPGDSPVELRALVTAFNGMLDRLDESFGRLSQFSSDLAHELRTPINNLMGEAQVALSRARTADEYRAVVESSVEELERLSRMSENMLFLARADDAQQEINRTALDARAELEKVAEFYQLVADESGVHIVCLGAATVHADALLFRRAVTNLLSNALRHTAGGGEIVMTARSEADGSVAIIVANPGPGIEAEHRGRIFDRFYRADPSRGKSSQGAGLGLAIVRSIMQLHGGGVDVVSAAGGLTEFTLHFPPAAA